MKKKLILIMIAAMLSAHAVFAGTGTGKVAVIYSGRSQVNRHVLQFFGEEIRNRNSSYQFEAFDVKEGINQSDYIALVVINTGVSSGINRDLSDFIDSSPDKSRLILVSLYRGRQDLTVETVPAQSNPDKIDAISSASIWEQSGLSSLFNKNKGGNPRQMHQQWINEVFRLIDRRA
ncbi:hypothetical protein [Spirochaeta isovalerica]|uniref:Uncharacterized protein n=1 Tax=Spirochaeta isovalerica TaxID=150 RepID=A0A841RAA0_9SPIO|nr:hypothetical protein [Spirochaeta isovalerica]MBB6479372.1 hypothetical protein [Spirochaeta isovalerica]